MAKWTIRWRTSDGRLRGTDKTFKTRREGQKIINDIKKAELKVYKKISSITKSMYVMRVD